LTEVREIMTPGVVTAGFDADLLEVARLMRDRGVGSVVLCDRHGEPAAIVTDRDLAVRALADGRSDSELARDHASRPLITGEAAMDLSEAAAVMVRHRIRRLPVLDDGRLAGIVTLDDIAVRTGDLEVARRMTREVIEGALPEFFFHDRGG
jgi:signal-transduction protein with cAMP-binding, CBS, and nucleotidyltransferase domain